MFVLFNIMLYMYASVTLLILYVISYYIMLHALSSIQTAGVYRYVSVTLLIILTYHTIFANMRKLE